MTQHLSISQVTLLVGITIGIGLVLVAYAIHKAFHGRREELDLNPKSPRAQDEAAFAVATLQGVITNLKAQQQELREELRATRERAKEIAHLSEIMIREMPGGLLVFDRAGFIINANRAVAELLQIDTWSRRRYPEMLGPESALTGYIRKCLESGKTHTREGVEYMPPRGESRLLEMTLAPVQAQDSRIGGAVCILTRGTKTGSHQT